MADEWQSFAAAFYILFCSFFDKMTQVVHGIEIASGQHLLLIMWRCFVMHPSSHGKDELST